MPEAYEYVARATQRILDVLDEHYAVVHPELEARIAEGYHRDSDLNIDPHHVTTALRDLYKAGAIVTDRGVTRGGREIATITKAYVGRQKTKTAKAVGRKRLLLARYQGWSQGTVKDPHGLVGPAGEAAVRGAILKAAALQPHHPDAGEVSQLLGVRLPGPLDSAGYRVPIVNGHPQPPVTVLFEVKNIRSWIYPGSSELYQLLRKGVMLQTANPGTPIVPILVCRRAHPTSFWMAHQMGFVLIELEAQYAGNVPASALDEVRNELWFTDLRPGTGPSLRVAERLTSSKLPQLMPQIAAKWQDSALDDVTADLVTKIARTTRAITRFRLVDELRIQAAERGLRGGW